MADRHPPADQDDPHDVGEARAHARSRLGHERPPERPQRESGEPERSDAERRRDHEKEGDQAGEGIHERHLEAAEQQPDQVAENAHHDSEI